MFFFSCRLEIGDSEALSFSFTLSWSGGPPKEARTSFDIATIFRRKTAEHRPTEAPAGRPGFWITTALPESQTTGLRDSRTNRLLLLDSRTAGLSDNRNARVLDSRITGFPDS